MARLLSIEPWGCGVSWSGALPAGPIRRSSLSGGLMAGHQQRQVAQETTEAICETGWQRRLATGAQDTILPHKESGMNDYGNAAGRTANAVPAEQYCCPPAAAQRMS